MTPQEPYRTRIEDVPLEQGLREDEGWIDMQVQFLIDNFSLPSRHDRRSLDGMMRYAAEAVGRVGFDGGFFKLEAKPARPVVLDGVLMRPYQEPHPPVWVASTSTDGFVAAAASGTTFRPRPPSV